jgi:uncharacterized membrane protein YphA (DoxX/SURF4 family)
LRSTTAGYPRTMLLRRIARPLLAGTFVYGGIGELRDPKSHAQLAEPVVNTVVNRVPIERAPSAITVVKLDAGIKLGAGILLALGKAPRLAAAVLAADLVATTLAGHRFWESEDPRERTDQLIHFLKNLGLLGGLLITTADTAGKPSLAWRGRHAGRAATAASLRQWAEMAAATDRASGKISGLAAEATGKASGLTAGVVGTATEHGRTLAGKAARLGEEVAGKATSMGEDLAGTITDAAGEVRGRLKTLAP